jgi:hypothetical protein
MAEQSWEAKNEGAEFESTAIDAPVKQQKIQCTGERA